MSDELKGLPLAQRNGVEVEYELDKNQPARVRKKGQPWKLAQPDDKQQQEHLRGGQPMRRGHSEQPQQGQPQRQRQTRQDLFHNPYNFIPALPRDENHAELGDNQPSGHHRYLPRLWSGKIAVQLCTETPLLIPDAARMTVEQSSHKRYPVRLTVDGLPYITPTSIKGMLRAAYEAVTNSRFAVFQGHEDRLAYRMTAGSGLALVPSRISGNSIELLLGATSDIPSFDENTGRWMVPEDLMYGAWLPRYHHAGGVDRTKAIKFADGSLPEHGNQVWAWVELVQHWGWIRDRKSRDPNAGYHRKDFRYWRVITISRSEEDVGDLSEPSADPGRQSGRSYHEPLGDLKPIRGYVCVTNQNINRKHDERVFFLDDGHPHASELRIPLQNPIEKDPLAVQWRQLIDNYQAAHREQDVWGRREGRRLAAPEEYLGREPGKTAWSRHIYLDGKPRRDDRRPQPDGDTLADGTLCYASVHKDGVRYRVLSLYPVMIARELYLRSPAALLSASLMPARVRTRLSPADRIFGWVGQEGAGAYRGNLRIGPLQCKRWKGKDQNHKPVENFSQQGLPLAILGQAKPQQARFYQAEDDEGEPLGEIGDRKGRQRPREKQECYVDDQGLRGRKVYPHHARLPGDYWANPADPTMEIGSSGRFKEYRRPQKDGAEQRDDQNRSLLGWVKPQTEFSFDIHVTNLSDVELGALLWLLDLKANDYADHFHRLGGGKPLGFGSVRLEIAGMELRDGDAWAGWYRSLFGIVSQGRTILDKTSSEFTNCVNAFKTAVAAAHGNGQPFAQVRFIQAFLVAARGFEKPIHYPRVSASPDPEGENFKWFVANERGPEVSLGALWEPDPGLPSSPE